MKREKRQYSPLFLCIFESGFKFAVFINDHNH